MFASLRIISVRKRGHPGGKINTAIGLPIKKRKIDRPVPFIKKPYSDCDLQCIQWFVDGEVATEVVQKNRILTEADCEQNPSAIPSWDLDENFSIRWMRRYMEADAYKTLLHVVAEKEKDPVFECGTCEAETEGTACIQCDSCLMWFHLNCVGKKYPPKTASWFCQACWKWTLTVLIKQVYMLSLYDFSDVHPKECKII